MTAFLRLSICVTLVDAGFALLVGRASEAASWHTVVSNDHRAEDNTHRCDQLVEVHLVQYPQRVLDFVEAVLRLDEL